MPPRHNHCYEQVHNCSAVRCCTRSTSRQPSNSNSMRSKNAPIPSRTETSPTVQKCTLRMHSQQTWPPLQTLSSAHKAHNVSVPATKDFMAHTTAATANLSSTRVRPRQSRPPALIIITLKLRDTLIRNPTHCVKSSICSTVGCRSSSLSSRDSHHTGPTAQSCRPSSQFLRQFRSSQRSSTMFQKQSVTADLGANDSSCNYGELHLLTT